jgi:hypothetical protein
MHSVSTYIRSQWLEEDSDDHNTTYIDIVPEYAEIISNHRMYKNIAHARWSVFFDTLLPKISTPETSTPVCVYSKFYGNSYGFWLRYTNGIIVIADRQPDEQKINEIREYLCQEKIRNIVHVFYGAIWSKDLRTYHHMQIRRDTHVYAGPSPDTSRTGGPFSDNGPFSNISGFHIRYLKRVYEIDIWIIQGRIYLYVKGKILEYGGDVLSFSRKACEFFNIEWTAKLRAFLNYLPRLQSIVTSSLKEGSYFLASMDICTVDNTQQWRDCGGPHNKAIDRLLSEKVRDDSPLLIAAYTAARQFEHGEKGYSHE